MGKNVIQELAEFSNSLDKLKMGDKADRLDKIAESVLDIKTAQYVGIQGYWIKNRRCWEGCYRQKRALKNIPAQEVWQECHEEYVNSINNGDGDWEKYASDDTLSKIASIDHDKINNEKSIFIKSIKEASNNGIDLPVAIFKTIDSNIEKYETGMLDNIDKIASLAVELGEEGYNGLSVHLSEIGATLLKEAGLFDAKGYGAASKGFGGGLWENVKGIGRKLIPGKKDEPSNLKTYIDRIQKYLSEGWDIYKNLQQMQRVYLTLNSLNNKIKSITNQEESIKSFSPEGAFNVPSARAVGDALEETQTVQPAVEQKAAPATRKRKKAFNLKEVKTSAMNKMDFETYRTYENLVKEYNKFRNIIKNQSSGITRMVSDFSGKIAEEIPYLQKQKMVLQNSGFSGHPIIATFDRVINSLGKFNNILPENLQSLSMGNPTPALSQFNMLLTALDTIEQSVEEEDVEIPADSESAATEVPQTSVKESPAAQPNAEVKPVASPQAVSPQQEIPLSSLTPEVNLNREETMDIMKLIQSSKRAKSNIGDIYTKIIDIINNSLKK